MTKIAEYSYYRKSKHARERCTTFAVKQATYNTTLALFNVRLIQFQIVESSTNKVLMLMLPVTVPHSQSIEYYVLQRNDSTN